MSNNLGHYTKDDAIKAIEAVVLYHESGGHEGDGTDEAMRQARQAIKFLRDVALPPPPEKA